MLHQAILWPEYFDMRLWSFELTHAVSLCNYLLNKNGISPIELYIGTWLDVTRIRYEKIWGCPAYVLDPRLQEEGNSNMRSEDKMWSVLG